MSRAKFFSMSVICLTLTIFLFTGVAVGKQLRVATASQEASNTATLKMIEYLKEKGIDVKMVEHSGGSKSTQAVIAKQVDFAKGGADEIMIAVSKGAEIRAFSPSSQPKINYVMVSRGDIKSMKDLTGKNYGISGPSGFDNLLTRIALKNNGIDPGSVKWTRIGGSSARAQALVANRVDAVTVFLPNWIDLKSKGDFTKIAALANEFPKLVQSLYLGHIDWLKENPDLAKAIIETQLKANEWAYNNKADWVEETLKFIKGRDRSIIVETYDNFKAMGMFDPTGGLSRSGAINLMELLLQSGDLEKRVKVDEWMAMDILKDVIQK